MSKLTRHVLYEKFSREKAAENFFVGFLNDHQIKISEERPDSVLYVKNDKVFMEHNQKSGNLWVSDEQIWSFFYSEYGYNYQEVRDLIKQVVWKNIKLKDVTPFRYSVGDDCLVWKNIKLKDVTPRTFVSFLLNRVWKNIKLKDVTPYKL